MLALELLWLPFLACLVLTGIHTYLGLHVLARGVVFLDLALAQVAALGMTAALLAGHPLHSAAAYWHAVAFTAAGAAFLALIRDDRGERGSALPPEALIGIIYAVAAAGTVLVLDRAPQGAEQIKQLLIGSLLGVTREEVATAAGLYAAVGVFHWTCRRPLLALSSGAVSTGSLWRARAWDFGFYFSFGLVVTSSVPMAGVLLVFSYLIVPAAIGGLLAASVAGRLAIGWGVGFLVSVAGLSVSYAADLPTGATVVAAFGGAVMLVGGARGALRLARGIRRDGARALAGLVAGVGILAAVAGAVLAAFPRADHYWLDAVEAALPAVRTAFLTPGERAVFADSGAAVARGRQELSRLRAQASDLQWGTREMPAEQQERLRQFIAGRGELVAGDRLVLQSLRRHARERQRFVIGMPLAAGGLALLFSAHRMSRWPR